MLRHARYVTLLTSHRQHDPKKALRNEHGQDMRMLTGKAITFKPIQAEIERKSYSQQTRVHRAA